MLAYDRIYRIEAAYMSYPIVDGAVRVPTEQMNPNIDLPGVQRWMFWVGPRTDHPTVVPFDLYDLVPDGDTVRCKQVGFDGEMRFIPLTLEWVWSHPEDYGATPEDVKTLYPSYEDLDIRLGKSVGYDEEMGPKVVEISQPAAMPTAENTFPAGTVRLVNGRYYEQRTDGTWVPADWFK